MKFGGAVLEDWGQTALTCMPVICPCMSVFLSLLPHDAKTDLPAYK